MDVVDVDVGGCDSGIGLGIGVTMGVLEYKGLCVRV